jgi:hypothetical protein
MRRIAFASLSLLAISACAPRVPDSGSGVGFSSYADYQNAREAELIANGEGASSSVLSAAEPISSQPISDLSTTAGAAASSTSDLAGDALTAIGQSPEAATSSAEYQANTAAVQNAVGISAENDFDAVASERSIAQDAARKQAISDSYQVIEPTAVLARPKGAQTSLVAFALSTTNSVGQPIYSRLTVGAETRAARNCAKHRSPDLAQEAFLAGGGPQRNVQGMDPDGDGFACSWDPAPFRNAAR